jgi:regulator of protease activity HflC (stomatin/prohibitin superfamily)
LNAAAGVKQKSILESEGMREAAKNEGEALAMQVNILAEALSGTSSAGEEHRMKALEALLETRRLEQLKAIASGTGNSTYFFGEAKGAKRDPYMIENMEKWKGRNSSFVMMDEGSHQTS